MTKLIPALALTFALVAASVGCANKNAAANSQEPAMNESVTDVDVAPMPPLEPEVAFTAPPEIVDPATPAPATPAPEAPVVTETPVAAEAGDRPGTTYTVQKGDTLFSIAREAYGNGGQWQRIANANPGLSPATLKAGTKIAIP